jgi:hypothetical protein
MRCPKCDMDISSTFEGSDRSVGIEARWYCDACDLAIAEWEVPREPMEDDVQITFSDLLPIKDRGTPISELSGRSGDPGFSEFCRIAQSYGFG